MYFDQRFYAADFTKKKELLLNSKIWISDYCK